MAQITPIDDAYIDEVIKAPDAYNPSLNKTQGVKMRELIKLLRDSLKQEIAENLLANQSSLQSKADLIDGFIPSSQLPSFVDDVLEFANIENLPYPGESGKLYLTTDTGTIYRWSGSSFVNVGVGNGSLMLGETIATAYRGDRGKIAYDHSQINSGNPHNSTKSDVGLGNVDNTSDASKPISISTQAALNGKQPTLVTGVNIKTVNGANLLGSGDITIPAIDPTIPSWAKQPIKPIYNWSEIQSKPNVLMREDFKLNSGASVVYNVNESKSPSSQIDNLDSYYSIVANNLNDTVKTIYGYSNIDGENGLKQAENTDYIIDVFVCKMDINDPEFSFYPDPTLIHDLDLTMLFYDESGLFTEIPLTAIGFIRTMQQEIKVVDFIFGQMEVKGCCVKFTYSGAYPLVYFIRNLESANKEFFIRTKESYSENNNVISAYFNVVGDYKTSLNVKLALKSPTADYRQFTGLDGLINVINKNMFHVDLGKFIQYVLPNL